MFMSMHKKSSALILILIVMTLGETVGFPGLGLTKPQEITTCILIIAAGLWVSEFVPLFLVSFLILALEIVWLLPALRLEGYAPVPDSFFSAFFSDIILLFLGGFTLSALMQKYGLDLRFAHFILRRTRGKPQTTLLGIIISCALLSMWISNTATAAMMLTIVFPLLSRVPEGHGFRVALVLSIPFACNIGGIGTPIGTPPNAIALSYLAQQGVNLSFIQWMVLTFPFVIFFLLLLWWLLLKMYPVKGLRLELSSYPDKAFTNSHWLAIGIFLTTAICWFFSKNLKLSTGTIALLPIIASFWFNLLKVSDFRKLPWDILYIISGGLALGLALTSSGLGVVIIEQLPINMSPFFLIIATSVVTGAMSTIMSNTATAGLIIPLIMLLPMNSYIMVVLALAVALMCSLAMALPVTTPPNAIAFSSRAIRARDMMVPGTIITLVGFILVAAIAPWYWKALMTLQDML